MVIVKTVQKRSYADAISGDGCTVCSGITYGVLSIDALRAIRAIQVNSRLFVPS